jgi:Uma2 family endonuclease
MYRVYWRRDIPGEQWVSNDIVNWEGSKLIVPDQPTFQQYRIKVVAINEKGEANVAPKEVIGYSGEDGESSITAVMALTVVMSVV